MNADEMRAHRIRHNERMSETDAFFREFGTLDDQAYEEGAISKKHKELMGLAISVATRCDECIVYHLDGCAREGASHSEIVEAVKIGVMAGGSITYLNAWSIRFPPPFGDVSNVLPPISSLSPSERRDDTCRELEACHIQILAASYSTEGGTDMCEPFMAGSGDVARRRLASVAQETKL